MAPVANPLSQAGMRTIADRLAVAVDQGRITAPQAESVAGCLVLCAAGCAPEWPWLTWYRRFKLARSAGLEREFEVMVPEPPRQR